MRDRFRVATTARETAIAEQERELSDYADEQVNELSAHIATITLSDNMATSNRRLWTSPAQDVPVGETHIKASATPLNDALSQIAVLEHEFDTLSDLIRSHKVISPLTRADPFPLLSCEDDLRQLQSRLNWVVIPTAKIRERKGNLSNHFMTLARDLKSRRSRWDEEANLIEDEKSSLPLYSTGELIDLIVLCHSHTIWRRTSFYTYSRGRGGIRAINHIHDDRFRCHTQC